MWGKENICGGEAASKRGLSCAQIIKREEAKRSSEQHEKNNQMTIEIHKQENVIYCSIPLLTFPSTPQDAINPHFVVFHDQNFAT